MTDTDQTRIYQLISELRERTGLPFEKVRELMADYIGIFEYDRSLFDNKFRRKDRSPNYRLDEVLAIINAFTTGLQQENRCTAYEAIQLLDFTNMGLSDYVQLKEFFDEAEYMEAWNRHLEEHDLSPNQPSARDRPDLKVPTQPNGRGNQIFISYSKHDAEAAKMVRDALRTTGHHVWQDVTRIPGGSPWIEEINQAINESCTVVLIVSANSIKSYWVREEILQAQFYSIPVIPFVIDDIPLPFGVLQISEVNAYLDFDVGIKTLLEVVSHCLDETADKPASQRQLELEYLDNILDKYKEWKSLYIPVAGVVEILTRPEDTVIETTAAPTELALDFDQFIGEMLSDSKTRDFTDDILEAITHSRQALILGEAGSGKSTTLKRIAVDLAEKAKLSEIQPLPVLIELKTLGDGQSLEEKIKEQLAGLSFLYDDIFRNGRLALLFDDLSKSYLRNPEAVIKEIRTFTKTAIHTNSIMLLTGRTLDYNHVLDIGMPRRLFIKPLDPIRIYQFITTNVHKPQQNRDKLFWSLAGEEAKRFWDRFVTEVNNDPEIFWLREQLPAGLKWGYGGVATQYFYWNQWIEIRNRPNSLLQLACNPYMLFMITRVFIMQGDIPENRAKLFKAFVEYVLLHREGLSATKSKDLTMRLADLAFAMQRSSDASQASFQTVLQYLGDESAIYVAQNANILEANETVRFTHQLLQEYFAAHKLVTEIRKGLTAPELWPSESWWLPSRWDATAILSAGLQATDTSPIITWMQDAAPEVAARCATESGGFTPDHLRSSVAKNWAARLDEKPIGARASIGRALGIMGNDPRAGVGLTLEGLPDLDWIDIPEGEFVFGKGGKSWTPAFAMSRYPITYAQYQAFIDANDGFFKERWWADLARQENEPGFQSFRYTNHPRERVSWYDAVAFCRWLSYQLGFQVQLPTEHQWEKAARGTDGFIYPYGNAFDPQRGNVDLTGIGKTSAVGLFPEGASPFGLLDMSGNVFEWCLNTAAAPDHIELTGEERRSLRGGSWAHSQEHARADYRYSNRPEMRRNRIGFRIVRPG